MIGEGGKPDVFLGSVDFTIVDRESGWIAGVLLNDAGQRAGKVSIEGFPLNGVAFPNSPGRPSSHKKHLAVLLAWSMKCAELGGKMGEADDQTASLFKYSGGDKVRKIRNPLAKKIGLDLDKGTLYITDESKAGDGPPACSMLIDKPTIYQTQQGGLEILAASAIAWSVEMGEHVERLPCVRIVIDKFEPAENLAAWKAQGGPKIISIIRPG